MTNPYQEVESVRLKRGFTWAEWSIIVAVVLWVSAFLYGWSVHNDVVVEREKLAIIQQQRDEAQAALEAIRNTLSQGESGDSPVVEQLREHIDSLIVENAALLRSVANVDNVINRWQNYADELDSFVTAELATYWRSATYVRPLRVNFNLPAARSVPVQRR